MLTILVAMLLLAAVSAIMAWGTSRPGPLPCRAAGAGPDPPPIIGEVWPDVPPRTTAELLVHLRSRHLSAGGEPGRSLLSIVPA